MKKVLVGISGGVDSAVAAYLLKSQGYDVVGITLNLSQNDEDYILKEGGCCSLSSILDARRVCEILEIPFYVFNFKDIFKEKVVDYFINEYLNGSTPNPCVKCNKHIKFNEFLKKARTIGADFIATGHYAKIYFDNERYLLKMGKDLKKDQTYMLYNFTQDQLKHTLMPCSDFTKEEVRQIAKNIGLHIYNKKDSEEICFVPNNDHGDFIRNIVDIRQGDFVDKNGVVIGKHKGIVYYTIGQRRGLGLSFGRKYFVIGLNKDKNQVILGEEEDLYFDQLIAAELNFIPFDKLTHEMRVKAKIRYNTKMEDAIIYPIEDSKVSVKFDFPQKSITKGQSVVFYNDDLVIGGGIIL